MNLPEPLTSLSQWFRLRSLKGCPRIGQAKPYALLRLLGGKAPLMTHFLAYTGIGVSLLAGPVLPLVSAARLPGDSEVVHFETVNSEAAKGPLASQATQGALLFEGQSLAQARQTRSRTTRSPAQTPASRSGSNAASSPSSLKPVGSTRPEDTPPDLLLQKAGEKKADALAAFAEGLAAEEDGETERALEAYHRSLAYDPSNIELAVKVAFELAQRGEVPQGIDILKDAEKAAPKDFLPPLCLSQLFGKYLKKNDLAEKYALRALALAPDSFPPYLALFEIYTATKQVKKAEAILAKATKATSPDPLFWLQVAEIHSKTAIKEGESIPSEALEKITAALEKAYVAAEAARENNEGREREETLSRSETLIKIADFYVLLQQLPPAIPIYEKVIAESRRPRSAEILGLREKLARSLLAVGENEKAISILQKLIKDSPARYDFYELLGELHTRSGQLTEAIDAYRQALSIDATQPNSFLRIADLQLHNEQASEAVETLKLATQRFPRHVQVTFSLAYALREAKRYSEALTFFAEAEEIAMGRSQEELNGFFYFTYGVAAEQAGQTERAADLLAKSIRLDPSNAANAYNYLGYMWVEKGERLDEALQLIQQALVLEPENPAFIDSLGWCYYQLGRYEEALPHLQKAADTLVPEESVVFEHLGDAHLALGNKQAALEAWARAIAAEPKNAVLVQRIRKKEAAVEEQPAPPQNGGESALKEMRPVNHDEGDSQAAPKLLTPPVTE